MLENVKASLIDSSKLVPFEAFFNLHLMTVQDLNIVSEIKYNICRNHCSVLDVEKLSQDQYERLVNLI